MRLFPRLTLPNIVLDSLNYAASHVLPIVNPRDNLPGLPGLPILPNPEVGIIYEPGQITITRPVGLTSSKVIITRSCIERIPTQGELTGMQSNSGPTAMVVQPENVSMGLSMSSLVEII
jgi:hypothetical protein